MNDILNKNFYVYVYKDPETNIPFYVGKGKNTRDYSHLYEAKSLFETNNITQSLKLNYIIEIIKQGNSPIIERVEINLFEYEALELEIKLIKQYGRVDLGTGTLTNLTDGGLGTVGSIDKNKRAKNMDNVLQIRLNNNLNTVVLHTTSTPEHQHIEYSGDSNEIDDLIHYLNRKYKDNIMIGGFSPEVYTSMIEYIDKVISDGIYNISKVTQLDENLFYLVNVNDKISIGVTTTLNELFSSDIIDFNKSFIIAAKDKQTLDNLLMSTTIDFNIVDPSNIPFDITFMTLIHQKINILLQQEKVKFINMPTQLNKINTILSTAEVCDILQITKQTLSFWRKSNRIKYTKKSERKYSYNLKDVMFIHDNIIDSYKNNILNSSEVCELLQISKQTLSNWRKTNKIKYIKISNRLFQYNYSDVQTIMTDMLLSNTLSSYKVDVPKKSNPQIEDNITEWVKQYSYNITEQKYKNQFFFLNFGNIGIVSSPQVMISDDFKLVDYINNKTIIDNPKGLWDYLEDISKQSLKPSIDTSKQYCTGYSNLYLNKLFEGRKSFN